LPPIILTLLELSWQRAILVLAGFLVLNFVVDNLVKPRFMQSGLDVPPLVGLLSLVVWAYLLGPVGTLLALPLTIAVRRVLEDAQVAVPGLTRGVP
jgi:AI-2 transport protein TqsA